MNRAWKHLAGNILYGADPEKVSMEEINLLLDEYPYFAALHFMKAAKLAPSGSADTLSAKAKAALYFHNPHWFQVLLNDQDQVKENNDSLADIMTTRVSDEYADVPAEEGSMPLAEINREDSESAYDDKRIETTQESIEPEEKETEVDWVQVTPFTEEQPADLIVEQPVTTATFEHKEDEPEQPALTEIPEPNWHEETQAVEIPTEHISTPEILPEGKVDESVTTEIYIPEQGLNEIPTGTEEVEEHKDWHQSEDPHTLIEEENLPPVKGSDEEAPEESVWHSREQEEADDTEKPAEEKSGSETAPPLRIVFSEPSKDSLLPDIPFEPLHTIDYFASQGIKFNTEAGKDQLSIKLKSFTEWLRSMKRLHPEKLEHNMPKEEEAHIRETAESSNAAQNIVTEAMAEVFVKQGKKDRAIDLLEKLSLLDPSKSAYFAVRIRELKEN